MKAPVKPKSPIRGRPYDPKPEAQLKGRKSVIGKAPSKEGPGKGYANMPYYKAVRPTSKPRSGKNI